MRAVPRDTADTAGSRLMDLESALIEARCFLRVIELATDDRPNGFDKHDVGALNYVVGMMAAKVNAALDRNDGL